MKTLEETPISNFETPIDFPPFDFIPRSIFVRPLFEKPLKTSCTIEELFDDLDDGSIDTTLSSALSLANGFKEALSGGNPQRI